MRLVRRPGDSLLACTLLRGTLLPCSLLTLAACSLAESSAPLSDKHRVLAILQLEASTPLAASLNERARDSTVTWVPPVDGSDTRLFVPAGVIEIADTVRAGEPVPVVVNSIGENGCWQADGGTLTQRGDTAIVTAYDRHSGAAACTQLWSDRLRHPFTTTFPRPGVGIVRAYGRRVRAGYPAVAMPIVAQRTVVVIP
ncbi:MAG: hypothetical protein IPF98_11200 [Gemmatimonadetes bacterium]|nr:hypothetical protein [Gemmatimonadota bacterium]MCC6771654.1 hypothetical protein [Gemmatimonadaceae bacterium]